MNFNQVTTAPTSGSPEGPLIAAILTCLALTGCAEFRFAPNPLTHAFAAPALPPGEEIATERLDGDRPIRASARRFRTGTPVPKTVRVETERATIATHDVPETTGSTPLRDLPPDDPEDLRRWLEARRERASVRSRVNEAHLAELEASAARAMRSICTGC